MPAHHSTIEDQRGWYKEHGKPRNKLNKGGTRRAGTLGARMSTRALSKVYNPREGKVNPPAPITKRAAAMIGANYGETWQTSHTPTHNDCRCGLSICPACNG